MQIFFTGIKDVDILILQYLDDIDLCKISLISKYGKILSDYEPFWRRRIEIRFPYFLKTNNNKTKSLKEYYIYLSKLTSNLLKNIWVSIDGDPTQYSLEDLSIENKDDALMYVSSESGDLNMLKYLEETGADIHTNDDYAFRHASMEGYLEMVKYLFDKGADIKWEGADALLSASSNGHLEIVKYLIEKDVGIYDYPLIFACRNGHLDVVKYLVQNGADINETVISSANKHSEILEYLKNFY